MSSSELRQMQGGVLSHSCRQPDSQLWLSAVRTYNANLSADGPKKLTERLTKNNVSAEGQQRAVSGSGALGSLCCVMQTGSEDKDQHSERGKDVKAWGGEKLRRHREKKKKSKMRCDLLYNQIMHAHLSSCVFVWLLPHDPFQEKLQFIKTYFCQLWFINVAAEV